MHTEYLFVILNSSACFAFNSMSCRRITEQRKTTDIWHIYALEMMMMALLGAALYTRREQTTFLFAQKSWLSGCCSWYADICALCFFFGCVISTCLALKWRRRRKAGASSKSTTLNIKNSVVRQVESQSHSFTWNEFQFICRNRFRRRHGPGLVLLN